MGVREAGAVLPRATVCAYAWAPSREACRPRKGLSPLVLVFLTSWPCSRTAGPEKKGISHDRQQQAAASPASPSGSFAQAGQGAPCRHAGETADGAAG